MSTVKDNPVSTTGATGSLSLLVAWLAGVKDPEILVAIGIALGLVPGAFTAWFRLGGLKGFASKLWTGK